MNRISQPFFQVIRCYHRPPDRKSYFIPTWFKKNFDKNWNPRNPDGTVQHLNAFKCTLLIALLNLICIDAYRNKAAIDKGEYNGMDRAYDNYGIDIGLRSVTVGKEPACGDKCIANMSLNNFFKMK